MTSSDIRRFQKRADTLEAKARRSSASGQHDEAIRLAGEAVAAREQLVAVAPEFAPRVVASMTIRADCLRQAGRRFEGVVALADAIVRSEAIDYFDLVGVSLDSALLPHAELELQTWVQEAVDELIAAGDGAWEMLAALPLHELNAFYDAIVGINDVVAVCLRRQQFELALDLGNYATAMGFIGTNLGPRYRGPLSRVLLDQGEVYRAVGDLDSMWSRMRQAIDVAADAVNAPAHVGTIREDLDHLINILSGISHGLRSAGLPAQSKDVDAVVRSLLENTTLARSGLIPLANGATVRHVIDELIVALDVGLRNLD